MELQIEEWIKLGTVYAARLAEVTAALVIVIAVLQAVLAYFRGLWETWRGAGTDGDLVPKDAIRLSLGRSLALALELTLGADILMTAVAPTWEEIGKLAAIAVIRTALNYFLEQELRAAEKRRPDQKPVIERQTQT